MEIIALAFALFSPVSAGAEDRVPGEYLVQVKPAFRSYSPSQFLRDPGTARSLQVVSSSSGIYKVTVAPDTKMAAINSYFGKGVVKHIEPNYRIYPFEIRDGAGPGPVSDPQFSSQWGLQNAQFPKIDIGALSAWDLTRGSQQIKVAIIDTGVDYTHPDLKENIWVNEKEANGLPGVDDDGNGYVDDIHGYDFANNDADPQDDMGHGTHVAGIVGARGGNGIGVAGVNWNVTLMPIKFMKPDVGGNTAAAIQSVEYAVKNGARVINASWGGGARSQIFEELLRTLASKGILFVAAAGNAGRNVDYSPQYPAGYDSENVISVAAGTSSGDLATFSNYGRRGVDIVAPGERILSTVPGGGYEMKSGTSMAAPFVSGVAALILSLDPALPLKELRNRILKRGYRMKRLSALVSSAALLNAYGSVSDRRPEPEFDEGDPEQWRQQEYVLSSKHDFKDNDIQEFEISVPGAKRLALYFPRIDTEEGFDVIFVYNQAGQLLDAISGQLEDSYSNIYNENRIKIVFQSDGSNPSYGFDLQRVSYE